MKNNRLLPWPLWFVLLLPLVITLVVFARLPEQFPVHWNSAGQVDWTLPKFPGAFLLPLVCIAFLLFYLPSIPREQYERSPDTYRWIGGVLAGVFLLVHIASVLISLGMGLPMDFLAKLITGFLFLIVGNLLPKLRVRGSRLQRWPWLVKSRRFGGYLWMASGVIMLTLAFVPGTASALVGIGLCLALIIGPMLYARLTWRKEQ